MSTHLVSSVHSSWVRPRRSCSLNTGWLCIVRAPWKPLSSNYSTTASYFRAYQIVVPCHRNHGLSHVQSPPRYLRNSATWESWNCRKVVGEFLRGRRCHSYSANRMHWRPLVPLPISPCPQDFSAVVNSSGHPTSRCTKYSGQNGHRWGSTGSER